MAEEIKYKASVDISDILSAQQQIDMLTMRQATNAFNSSKSFLGSGNVSLDPSSQIAYNQAMSMATSAGMNNYRALDTRSVFNQMLYSNSIAALGPPTNSMQQSMTGFYGEPTISPTNPYVSSYQYPYHFIAGKPDFPLMNKQGFMRNTMSLVGGGVNHMLFQQGINGSLDTPVYRQIQMLTEGLAEQSVMGLANAGKAIAGAGVIGAGTLASGGIMALPGMLGAGAMGVAAGAVGAGTVALGTYAAYDQVRHLAGGVGEQLESAKFFRDSMAPYIRSNRLGGGPDYNQMKTFVQGNATNVANDMYFTRQDFDTLQQMAVSTGMMQVVKDPEGAVSAINNIAKNLKTLTTLGTATKSALEMADGFTTLGLNMGGSGGKFTDFATRLSVGAFQAGVTQTSMMPGLLQAGQLYSQQGLAPTLGASTHIQSQAMTGELLRSGGLNLQNLAYYGGRDGFSGALTTAFSTMNRTPIGQLMTLSMANNPNASNKILSGNFSTGNLINEMSGFGDPEKYLDLKYMTPELSQNFSPEAMGPGQVLGMMRMYSDALGGKKLSPGTVAFMLERTGLSPRDAGAFVKSIQGSAGAEMGSSISAANKLRQVEMENFRTPYNFFSSTFYKNLGEKLFEEPIAGISGGLLDLTSSLEHSFTNFYLTGISKKGVANVRGDVGGVRDILSEMSGKSNILMSPVDLSGMKERSAMNYIQNSKSGIYREIQSDMVNENNRRKNELKSALNQRGDSGNLGNWNVSMDTIYDIKERIRGGSSTPSDMESLKKFILSKNTGENQLGIINDVMDVLGQSPSSLSVLESGQSTNDLRQNFLGGFNSRNITEQRFKDFSRNLTSKDSINILNDVFNGVNVKDEPQKALNKFMGIMGVTNTRLLTETQQREMGGLLRTVSDKSGGRFSKEVGLLMDNLNENAPSGTQTLAGNLDKYFSGKGKSIERVLSGGSDRRISVASGLSTALEFIRRDSNDPELINSLITSDLIPGNVKAGLTSKDPSKALSRIEEYLQGQLNNLGLSDEELNKSLDFGSTKHKSLIQDDQKRAFRDNLFGGLGEYITNVRRSGSLSSELAGKKLKELSESIPGLMGFAQDPISVRKFQAGMSAITKNFNGDIGLATKELNQLFEAMPSGSGSGIGGRLRSLGSDFMSDLKDGKLDGSYEEKMATLLSGVGLSGKNLEQARSDFQKILSEKDPVLQAQRFTRFSAGIPKLAGAAVGTGTQVFGNRFGDYIDPTQKQGISDSVTQQQQFFQLFQQMETLMTKQNDVWQGITSSNVKSLFENVERIANANKG